MNIELDMTVTDHNMLYGDDTILNAILAYDPYHPTSLVTPLYNTTEWK